VKHKLTEAQIAVHWKEDNTFALQEVHSRKLISQIPAFVKKFGEKIFPRMLRPLRQSPRLGQALAQNPRHFQSAFWKWFVGGKLNASYNCVDRHLAKHKNKAGSDFRPEPENEQP